MRAFNIGDRRGFTLLEVIISIGILALVFSGTISLLSFQRTQCQKAEDHSIVVDFVQHFMELARNQEYANIAAGHPINDLFDGSDGALRVVFPPDGEWQTVSQDNNIALFHPPLAWLRERNLQYRCTITKQFASGEERAKTIDFEVRWLPPLSSEDSENFRGFAVQNVIYPDFH